MPTGSRRAPRRETAERNDRALLRAAREVIGTDGAHASVAAIAARAGVGIGSLYRRYRSKGELFQHLCELALEQWLRSAEEGLAHDDPWQGFAHYFTAGVESGPGSLAPLAGLVEITPQMETASRRGDAAIAELIDRAHAAGVLRADVTPVDLALLIEQLNKSPLLDQLSSQGRTDLLDEAATAKRRIAAIALDGLRAPGSAPLPGDAPSERLITDRWEPPLD